MTKKDIKRPTVILNNIESDGFLDFNSKHDLKQVIEVLNKMMEG
jgi:hypothetical protein